MIKILHCADIHLDSPLCSLALRNSTLHAAARAASRTALSTIVALALAEKAAAVLLCGDVFDSQRRSAQTLAFLRLQLERLNKAEIQVYYIKGNHDAENPLSDAMDWPANTHIFSAEGESFTLPQTLAGGRAIMLHGVSFAGKQAGNLLPKMPAPNPHAVNIGLLHTSLGGAAGHDVYAPCSLKELAAKGYDYCALGHIHKRAVYREGKSLIVMPGTPQGRDIGEDGEKSVTMLHIADNGALNIAEKITCDLAFMRLSIDVSGMIESEELHRALDTALAELSGELRAPNRAPNAAVRIRLQGETALHWRLLRDADYWQGIAQEHAEACGNLLLDKLEILAQSPQESGTTASALPVEELARLMAQAAGGAELRQYCDKSFDTLMRAYLPHELREGFSADAEQKAKLLEDLISGGAEHITALLETHGQSFEGAADTAEEA